MNSSEIASLWEPLAEKIGRPAIHYLPPDVDPHGTWMLSGRTAPREMCPNANSFVIAPEVAAALWRDHAVRWLATKGVVGVMLDPPEIFVVGQVEVGSGFYRRGGLDAPWLDMHGVTLDHALAAACRAVLAEVKA